MHINAFVLCVFTLICAAKPAHGQQRLTLDEARQLTRTHNLDVQLARERLFSAAAVSKKAWAILLPTVAATGAGLRNDIEIAFTLPVPAGQPAPQLVLQKLYQASGTMSANWAFLNGRALPLLKIAHLQADMAAVNFKQTETTLLHATTLSYYAALNADWQVEIRRRALKNARDHLELTQARLAVGEETRVQVMRSEVELAAAEHATLRAENAARLAHQALATLIGWTDAEGHVPEFTLERPREENPSFQLTEPLLQIAYDRRLDLQQYRLQLEITQQLKNDTWGKFLPVVAATGNYRASNAAGFAGRSTTWYVGFALSWNIFDGATTYWELKERQHDMNAAALRIEKTRRDIAQQIIAARLDLEAADALLKAATRQATLARETASLVNTQYQVGAATQLDLFDAHRLLADGEANEALAQLATDLAKIALEQVLLTPPLAGAQNAIP